MSKSSLALYIHWPFCKIKCPYCDFNSYKREKVNQSHWIEAYLKTLELWSSRLKQRKISSIFFGGGTPSLLDPHFVERVLQKTDNLWGISSDCEVTIEANPNSVSDIKFKVLRNIGMNRVSVGVQALNNKDLKNLGRDHDKNQAIEALQIVEKWFRNYNLDFIYGRQYQSTSEWSDELSKIMALEAPHLSLYQLTIEENTHFYKLFKRNLLKGIPNHKTTSEMFDVTKKLCESGGYKQYETSNFAKKGFKCRHNLSYWKYDDYLGIGPGAHGRIKISGKSYATEEEGNPDIWLKKTLSSNPITPKITSIEPRVVFEEKLIKLESNQIVMTKRGTKMLDHITRSLIDCY